jgi:quercetin dioxygenase-like cupin family protein
MITIEESMRADPKRPWQEHYDATSIEIVVDTPTLRVLDAIFSPGQCVPWHRHSQVTDYFWVVEGRLQVETRCPDQVLEIGPGGYCAVAAGCEHRVTNVGDTSCRVVNLQGFGAYDFVRPERREEAAP